MADSSEKPDFIVDPDGNIRDVRREKYSSAQNDARTPPPVIRSQYVKSRGTSPRVIFIPIGLILTLILAIFRYAASPATTSNGQSVVSEGAYNDLQSGIFAYSDGDYDRALVHFNLAIDEHPNFGEAYNDRGLVYWAKGDTVAALADFEKAIQLLPKPAAPYGNRGSLYSSLGKYSDALSDLNKAIEINPHYAKAYQSRGIVYLNLANPEQAVADFDKAIEATHKSAEFQAKLNQQPTSQFGNGLQEYISLMDDDADLYSVYTYRGIAFQSLSKLDKAIEDFNKAIEIQPYSSFAYYNRGLAYYSNGYYEQATVDLQKVIELNDDPIMIAQAQGQLDQLNSISNAPDNASYNSDSFTSNGMDQQQIFSLVIDPLSPNILYASTGYGIFKSTTGAHDWIPINNGLTDQDVRALAIDPLTPATLYAGTSHLFKSTDSGESWLPSETGMPEPFILSMAIDPTLPSTLYAGTMGSEVFKSTDSGQSWKLANNGIHTSLVLDLEIDPTRPKIIYAGAMNGLYKSLDGGQSWEFIDFHNDTIMIMSVAVDPVSPTIVYAGTMDGLFKSTDGGRNWNPIHIDSLTYVSALVVDPANSNIVYAGGNTVCKSTDGGDSWTLLDSSGAIPFVRVLVLSPTAPATLYVGTEEHGVMVIPLEDKE